MSDLSDIREGIKTVLEANLAGFRVYDYPEDNLGTDESRVTLQPPCGVIEAEEPDGQYLTIGSGCFEVIHTLTIYVRSGSPREAWKELDEYRSPSGTKSIRAALRQDRTLDGKADNADVLWASSGQAEQFGNRPSWQYTCQVGIQVIKSVS